MARLVFSLLLLAFVNSAQSAPLPTYEVSIKDGVFSPPSLSVPKKKRFKIRVHNTGTSPAEFENLSLRVEKVLGPGVSSFVIVPPLKVGTYSFIDEFHLDSDGLKIIVTEDNET